MVMREDKSDEYEEILLIENGVWGMKGNIQETSIFDLWVTQGLMKGVSFFQGNGKGKVELMG